MDAIKLNTRLGNSTLKLSGVLRNDKIKEIAEFALQYLTWHVWPASAYSKDSGFKRDDEYSDALSDHLKSEGQTLLGKFFTDVKIETAKWDKPSPIAKLIKDFLGLGFSEDEAKVMAADTLKKLQAKNNGATEEAVDA